MKHKNLLRISFISLWLLSTSIISAQVIYNADFSNNGDGFADHTTASPPASGPASVGPFGSSGNQWSLSYTTTPSSDTTPNTFKVVGGVLKSDDWGGVAKFQSQTIDVSGINTINISAVSINVGANDNLFKYFYILDGGTIVESSNISSADGGNVNYTISNLDVSGASTLVVGFEFSENGGSQGYETSSFSVTSVGGPATPGITLTAVSGNTNESGTTATFTAVLNAQPATDVVLNISSADIGEVTVSPTTLTFTNLNWETPQQITLTGVNDALFDGNIDVTITVAVDDAISADTYDAVADITRTVTNEDDELNSLIINEILADPDLSTGDANGDGTVHTSNDEFIELYNSTGAPIDISGYKLSDGTSQRHIFPNGTIIPAKGTLVLFGGGNPTGIAGLVQVSSTNLLSLNNTGDIITIVDASDALVVTLTYGAADNNQSIARNPDFTGDFVGHSTIVSNAVQFSPGRDNSDNIPFIKTWSGATNTDWVTATNWLGDSNPGASDNVIIHSGLTNYPTASGAVTINSVIINSGASLIAQDAFTGNITYKRTLAYNALITEGWHLVSSPVVGETYDNAYVAANGLAINNANNAIATYTTGTNAWSYMQTDGGGTFMPGIGYSVKKQSSAGDISFTGTLNTSDVSVGVVTGGVNNFNLLGNPFTSYLNSESFLNGNSGSLVSTDIWVFNQASSNYEVKNLASSFVLAPAQGFFVKANAETNLNIAESYQVATGDAFQKTVKPEITLNMTDGSNNRFAKIYYLDNATTSFDNGYDGETFGGIANTTDVFTHLVANSEGKKYQVQSLPNSDFENMVVPVGIKAAAGKEITFSAEAMNLPDGINVYLEDRTANTVTLLSEANATYKVTLGESLDGIGRFYLHTKASGILSTTDVALNNISIYSPAKSTLRIAGLSQGKASVKIYSVLGKQVFANTYNTTGVIDMNLPTLATGLYVVQLATEKGTLNKKITLE